MSATVKLQPIYFAMCSRARQDHYNSTCVPSYKLKLSFRSSRHVSCGTCAIVEVVSTYRSQLRKLSYLYKDSY